jgi:hypothetical protein
VHDVFCHNYVFVLSLIPSQVKIPESVKDNDKITSETAPDNFSKSDNENKDIPDNLSDQTDYYVIKINTVGKCIDVELYRKQITLHLPFKHALMCFMNETADVVYKLFPPKWRILTMKTLSYKLRRLSICSFIFCKEFPSWTRVEI